MPTVMDELNNRVLPALSLESVDASWLSTLNDSRLFRAWLAIRAGTAAALSKASAVAGSLQQLSFAVAVILFFILPAPMFASDKEWLALVVATGFGLRVLGSILNGPEKYRPSAVDGVVLLYFAINVIASFASHYLKDSLFGLAKLFVYLMAYFLFVGSLQFSSKKRMIVIISAAVFSGFLVSLYGLYQYKTGVAPLATWEDPTIEDKATRIYGTLGNPNLLAGYFVPLVPFAFTLSMIAAVRKGVSKWLSVPLLAITAIITVATFLTGSRGGYIALIAMALVIGLVAFSWTWKEHARARIPMLLGLVALPVVAVLVLHFALPSFEHRFMSIFAGSEHSSNAYRMNVWRSSLQMLKDNWVIGIGTGNKTFRLAYGLYMRSGFDALGTYCVPLEVAVETGIPGLLAFCWLMVACFARAHRRFWGTGDSVQRWLAVAGITAIVGMMAQGLFDTVFYRPQVQFLFWLAISLLVALPGPTPRPEKDL